MRRTLSFLAALVFSTAPLAAQNPPQKQGAPQRGARPDSVVEKQDSSSSVSDRGAKSQISIMREVYSYNDGSRRDPMISLMGTSDIRPLLTELQLKSILFDESGTKSTALLQNTVEKGKQYRVSVGMTLGRMKVAQITRSDVVFSIDEYGLSRQERLTLKPDTTRARTP